MKDPSPPVWLTRWLPLSPQPVLVQQQALLEQLQVRQPALEGLAEPLRVRLHFGCVLDRSGKYSIIVTVPSLGVLTLL